MIWESEWSCCREVDLVRDLAEEHVFLSERECRDEYESLIQLHTRAIATQIKDIESQFQSRAGQADVSAELGTLEKPVDELEQLRINDAGGDGERHCCDHPESPDRPSGRATATIEEDAERASDQFQQGQYAKARQTFDTLVDRIDDIHSRTPDDVVDEYETELTELRDACETNANRTRREDLGFKSGLRTESTDILGAKLRRNQTGPSGDTEVYNPSKMGDNGPDS